MPQGSLPVARPAFSRLDVSLTHNLQLIEDCKKSGIHPSFSWTNNSCQSLAKQPIAQLTGARYVFRETDNGRMLSDEGQEESKKKPTTEQFAFKGNTGEDNNTVLLASMNCHTLSSC